MKCDDLFWLEILFFVILIKNCSIQEIMTLRLLRLSVADFSFDIFQTWLWQTYFDFSVYGAHLVVYKIELMALSVQNAIVYY